MCDIYYTWNLEKWCRWTSFQSRNTVTDVENKLMVTKDGRGEGWIERLGLTYTHCYIKEVTIGTYVQYKECYSVLCEDLNGKEIKKNTYVCVYTHIIFE